jgi:hypothetical protein
MHSAEWAARIDANPGGGERDAGGRKRWGPRTGRACMPAHDGGGNFGAPASDAPGAWQAGAWDWQSAWPQ